MEIRTRRRASPLTPHRDVDGDREWSRRRSLAHPSPVGGGGFRVPNAAALFLGARTLVGLGPVLLVLVPAVCRRESCSAARSGPRRSTGAAATCSRTAGSSGAPARG